MCGTDVQGHGCAWAPLCFGTTVLGNRCAWSQLCLGTNVLGHRCAWAPLCLGTAVLGHRILHTRTFSYLFRARTAPHKRQRVERCPCCPDGSRPRPSGGADALHPTLPPGWRRAVQLLAWSPASNQPGRPPPEAVAHTAYGPETHPRPGMVPTTHSGGMRVAGVRSRHGHFVTVTRAIEGIKHCWAAVGASGESGLAQGSNITGLTATYSGVAPLRAAVLGLTP